MDSRSRIRDIICNLTQASHFDESFQLIDSGMFDSFQIANLIADLENEFQVKIPGYKVSAENFNTLDSILRLIEELKK